MTNAMEKYEKYIANMNETGAKIKIEIIETSWHSHNFALLSEKEGYHLAMLDFDSNVQLIRFYNKSEKVEAYKAFNALKFKASEMYRP